jgi:CRISPR system Cascade subunit CasC
MLQNFAPSCLNRDDTNSPKECQFGGYRRARISSQCIKRAIREDFKKSLDLPPEFLARRSKLFVDKLTDKLIQGGKRQEEARVVAIRALNSIGLGVDEKDNTTQYLLFLGEKELNNMAEMVLANWAGLKSIDAKEKAGKQKSDLGKKLKGTLDGGKAVDLALFGRMLADLPDKNIDAACQVAHAISTNKVNVEFDFYTAVDDIKPKEEAGAGMMGTIEFNSACYYRYANIDLEQLKKNLGNDEALAYKAIEAFLRASVNAIPSGKQTSMASPTPPDFILAVVRDSGAWSLANAFAKPVSPGSNGNLVEHSITALVDYWNRLVKVYGDKGVRAKPALALVKAELTGLNPVENMDRMIREVMKAVTGGSQKGG